MTDKLSMDKVVPEEQYEGEDPEDSRLVADMLEEAKHYLRGFSWCREVVEVFVGIAVGGVVGVFLVHIAPSQPEVDEWLWVVVGDLPPVYITTEDAPTPAAALDGYIGAMEEWVDAVRSGRKVDGLIPVNAPATPEYAKMLASRLSFLDQEVLPMYTCDPDARL